MRGDAFEVLDSLRDSGMELVEVYSKEGRGRRFVSVDGRHESQSRREKGWAVRAGDAHCSFFAAGVGRPRAQTPWPVADGYALRLPEARPLSSWSEPEGRDSALVGEVEVRELVAGVTRSLEGELPGARIDLTILEDGSAESLLVSSRGVEANWRHRLATLRIEASWDGARVELERAERSVAAFHPMALAQQLADRLMVLEKGTAPERDRGEIVLAPPVGARLLASLRPLFFGERATKLVQGLLDRRGRLGSAQLTVVDDGRLASGLLAAPVDGEGVPCGRKVLIQDGVFSSPIQDWREAGITGPAPGSMQRSSWRDLPQLGPSHLYIEPSDSAPRAVELIEGVTRGYYLVEVTGPATIDWNTGRFSLPVCGFAMDSGSARSPVAKAWLHGSLGSMFRGIQAVAGDLAFYPMRGMIGSPTLLVGGLELRSTP